MLRTGRFPAIFPSRVALLAVLAGLSGGCGPSSDPGDDPLADEIRTLAAEALRTHPSPGLSIGVQQGDDLRFAEGFGLADLEHRVPATADTVYRIGSVTKQFTGAAVMALVEEGRLDLDADLRDLLPDYDTRDFSIPVERLLNHTSGIKGYTEMDEFWAQARLDLDHRAMMDLFGGVPFEFEPGDRYQYNNSGYYLLGVLIERISGGSYAEFLEERLFRPLGLDRTHYLDNDPIVPDRASGYEPDREGGFRNDEPISMKLPYAAGSLGSTVRDLLAWQRALVRSEAVSSAGYERMTAPGELIGGAAVPYGYGLGLGREHGLDKVSHGGGINGFRAQLAYYPEAELGIAVLMNSGAGRPGLLENRIARAVLGMEQPRIEEAAVDSDALERYAGTYDPGRAPVTITLREGALYGLGRRLAPVGGGVFHPEGDPFTRIEFADDPEGGPSPEFTITSAGNPRRFHRVPDA